MNFKFDLADLQAFCAVAKFNSFRAAAQSLHLSQPALSRRIDKLEGALGVKLLERTTRSVRLSNSGREFARKAQSLLDELDTTILGMEELATQRSGVVTVACVPSATRYFLPQVLQRFHAQFPRIRVRVHDAHANDVLAVVASGDADFGLNFLGKQEAGMVFKPLSSERFVLVCRMDHPLASKRSVKWAELKNHAYLSVDASSGNRLLIERALAKMEDRPQPIFEARHIQTVLGLVEAGLGVAVAPQLAMPTGNTLLRSIPLTAPAISRELGLITMRGRQLSPAAAHLYGFIAALKKSASA
ncbi:MAG: LysR family transcriptional regulator [Brachymonas sp.]|nr:LysR family transcriptional regulator [Brachymonas sp.]